MPFEVKNWHPCCQLNAYISFFLATFEFLFYRKTAMQSEVPHRALAVINSFIITCTLQVHFTLNFVVKTPCWKEWFHSKVYSLYNIVASTWTDSCVYIITDSSADRIIRKVGDMHFLGWYQSLEMKFWITSLDLV